MMNFWLASLATSHSLASVKIYLAYKSENTKKMGKEAAYWE